MKRQSRKQLLSSRSGQVITEYVMILSLVVAALATTRIKIDGAGNIDFSGQPGSRTIMQAMSDSFTVWIRDILIVVSLPS